MSENESRAIVVEAMEFVVVNGVYRYVRLAESPVFDEQSNAEAIRYLIEQCQPSSVEDRCELERAIAYFYDQMAFRVCVSDEPYAYRRFPVENGESYVQDVAIEHVAAMDEDGEMVASIVCSGVVYRIEKTESNASDIIFRCSLLADGIVEATTVISHSNRVL
jgi:hypothetical protein